MSQPPCSKIEDLFYLARWGATIPESSSRGTSNKRFIRGRQPRLLLGCLAGRDDPRGTSTWDNAWIGVATGCADQTDEGVAMSLSKFFSTERAMKRYFLGEVLFLFDASGEPDHAFRFGFWLEEKTLGIYCWDVDGQKSRRLTSRHHLTTLLLIFLGGLPTFSLHFLTLIPWFSSKESCLQRPSHSFHWVIPFSRQPASPWRRRRNRWRPSWLCTNCLLSCLPLQP